MNDPISSGWAAATRAAQALGGIDEPSRAIVPPIHVATTYIRDPDNQYRSGNIYARPDNPTIREAEAIIASLEGAAAPARPGVRSAAQFEDRGHAGIDDPRCRYG